LAAYRRGVVTMGSRYRPEHQRMLNDKRWTQTKAVVWQRAKGLCEECAKTITATGRPLLVAGVDCHHVIPFESAKTQQEAEALCYNPDNVRLLCVRCHINAHTQAKSHTKEAHQAREAERLARWASRHTKK
jgi:5-methylcytosine-specific restriction endonuclease McrA